LNPVEAALKGKINGLTTELVQLKARHQQVAGAYEAARSELERLKTTTKSDSASASAALVEAAAVDEARASGADQTAVLREKFRSRLQELEQKLTAAQAHEHQMAAQVSRLQADNVELVGRIKYLQRFQEQQRHKADDPEAGGAALGKYSELYEQQMNPFTAFSRDEKLQRYKALNPAEKIILNTVQFFLMTKTTRLFLFSYVCALHMLVSIMLWGRIHG